MVRAFKSSDEGKRVVTSDGDNIGKVRRVNGDEAHVRPKGGLADSIRQRLGMGSDEDMYVLNHDEVDSITDDEIKLKQ
jgi:sporulation protein YlmC with PRC-barrel domain